MTDNGEMIIETLDQRVERRNARRDFSERPAASRQEQPPWRDSQHVAEAARRQ